jgi:hypothetical protein
LPFVNEHIKTVVRWVCIGKEEESSEYEYPTAPEVHFEKHIIGVISY